MSTPTTRYAGTNNMEAASPPLTPIQDPKTDKITTSDVSTVSGDCQLRPLLLGGPLDEQRNTSSTRLRRVPHRRRPAGVPPRLRHHATDRPRPLVPPRRP